MADIEWIGETLLDLSTNYDSTTQYDGNADGRIFWGGIFGPYWLVPKIDWTANDYYNFEDLNRVETYTAQVATMVFLSLATIANRTTKSFEFADSMNRIESNIKTIADNLYNPVGWETPKLNWQSGIQGGGFGYKDANRLEKNLLLLFELITRVVANYKYCGTFACGEDVIV